MDYAKALAILKEGTDLLEQMQCKWWLSAGTALGAYRDHFNREFVERDTDIDVGILNQEDTTDKDPLYTSIREKFLCSGFTSIRTYRGNGYWTQLALAKDGIIFDIYFFYLSSKDTMASYTEHGTMQKPYCLINEMKKIRIENNAYYIPTPIEKYLFLRYGKNWRVPSNAKVSWEKECANIDGIRADVTDFAMGC